MGNKFKLIQVGLGPMGRIIATLLLKRQNLDLKGVVDIDPQLKGKRLSELLNIESGSEIIIEQDIDKVISREKVDVMIIATSSSLEKVAPIIKKAIESEINVVSICEELSYPFQKYLYL